jgi:hypothetical protein
VHFDYSSLVSGTQAKKKWKSKKKKNPLKTVKEPKKPRIFHSYGDVTIASEGLHNIS